MSPRQPTSARDAPFHFQGRRAAQRRIDLGLTQMDFAHSIRSTPTEVSRYENGASQPGAQALARIAYVLGLSTDYLLGLTDDPIPVNRKKLA